MSCTGTDITARVHKTVLNLGYVLEQTLQIEMLCTQSNIWGMYRDRHYSKLKYLSTEQRLGTFEVLVFLLGRLGWTWGLITNHREIDT